MSEEESAGDKHDLSNMGRCVRCGETVDMRDEEHGLVVMERPDIDHPDVDREDADQAMADAIRRAGGPEDEPIAKAYEDGEEIVLHQDCHDESGLTELYASEAQMEAMDSE